MVSPPPQAGESSVGRSLVEFHRLGQKFQKRHPPEDALGRSSILSLSYVSALTDAAELEETFGDIHIAAQYRATAAGIKKSRP